ncbi:MAG: protein-disulfide reductase DsbD family protein [Elusimicrobiota bacterium]
MKHLLVFAFILAGFPLRAEAPHVKADLLAETASIRPGEPFWAAVRLRMDEGWHTYWKNPGESGLPTRVTWKLPPGFKAGPLQWPAPWKIEAAGVVSYGYEGTVLLLVRLEPPPSLKGKEALLAARVDWLECADICLPGRADVSLRLPVKKSPPAANPARAPEFAAARSRLPLEGSGWTAQAAASPDEIRLALEPPDWFPGALSGLQFFAEEAEAVDPSAPQTFLRFDGKYGLLLRRPDTAAPMDRLKGVLVSPEGWRGPGSENALAVDVPLPEIGLAAGFSFPGKGAEEGGPAGLTLASAVALAFAGGLLLNLMPCVFPVLSLKILGFVRQAGNRKEAVRRHGLIFAAGVLVSFWILAGLLSALAAGGQRLGWGFQLQSPAFVAVMGAVFFLLGLNLLGVFEIGASLTRAGGLAPREGTAGAFWSGVLAVVVATPCTAPFMGPALGFAAAQSAPASLAVFTGLGAGMALPYVALSFSPGLLKRLPRPGPWMETFKQAMAFPFFAAAVWLLWVLGRQRGADALAAALAAFLLMALGAWIWGRSQSPTVPRFRRLSAGILFIAALAGGLFWTWRQASSGSAPAASTAPSPGLSWEAYSTSRLEELRRAGRPVFVDFTADWCLSCQVNKRLALSSPSVIARFKEKGVVPLKADWTSYDPEITRALKSHGRNSVPLYVLYGKDPRKPPKLLPTILTPDIVLRALDEL